MTLDDMLIFFAQEPGKSEFSYIQVSRIKNKIFCIKNMQISHEKQILYVLPILNNNDEARG